MPRMTMVQAINHALHEEMRRDERVVVLGEDVGVNEGVFRVTAGLHAAFGEGRVIDTPLAESTIVGASIGMAMAGLIPVAEIQFSGFAFLGYAQLEGNAARLRSRTHGQWTCPMVLRMPYGGGVRALEHHSESREATFAGTPGLKVVIPSGPRNARALLLGAIRDPDPVVYMEPKHSYRAFREEVPEEEEVIEVGRAQVVKEGRDITVVSWGAMMPPTLKAVAAVEAARGVSVEVIDLLTISPMDSDTVVGSGGRTGRCVVVEEAPRSFSAASEIVARINDRVFYHLEAPVKRIAHYDIITPYFQREALYMPDADRIRRGIEETLSA